MEAQSESEAGKQRRSKRRSGCIFVSGMMLGVMALAGGSCWVRVAESAHDLDGKLNGEGPNGAKWSRAARPCAPPNSDQLRRDEAMAHITSIFPAGYGDTGLGYVVQYFGWHWRISDIPGDRAPRCPPAAKLYAGLWPTLDRVTWPTLRTDRSDLGLAEGLPPSKALAGRLARIGFNEYLLTDGPLGYDNRPFARILLGDQGQFAGPWAARALAEIGGTTKLGTSAAYLAVNAAPDQALPRVSSTLRKTFAVALARQEKRNDEAAFNVRDGFRLYELAFALSVAGAKAEPYSEPLIDLLDHKFAAGTHFGLLFLDPVELCKVAEHVGGKALAAANRRPYCRKALIKGAQQHDGS